VLALVFAFYVGYQYALGKPETTLPPSGVFLNVLAFSDRGFLTRYDDKLIYFETPESYQHVESTGLHEVLQVKTGNGNKRFLSRRVEPVEAKV